jgi:D-xylose 1-dehydrogenase (NADP+, D-xylono-1,5-lactone-forming)
MTASNTPLRIGILGAAKIARAFIAGVAPSLLVKVMGVASREAAKAEAFANEYAIPKHYGSYDAMLADPGIDAVYNPLPNSLHAEWSIHAVQAGKHVLCEKPLAVSGQEARAMFDAAKRKGVHLVEAYPYLAQAQTLKARELVKAGALGRLQLIRASFGVQFTDVTNIRLMPALAGGSLMDAGSYPVSLVRAISGERPARVHAVARWTETGVDKTLAATLEYDSGLIAQITSSFATGYHRHAQIMGDAGTMEFTYLNHPPIGGAPSVHLRRGIMVTNEIETIEVPGGNGFQLEAESFARLVQEGPAQWTGATPQESIDIALTLEALLKSARDKASVAVG